MKFLISLFALLMVFPFAGRSQNAEKGAFHAPYQWMTPSGWSVERFPIPIEFAPQIAYEGLEDLRFTPGWANPESEQHWSYAFLWWLDGTPPIDAETLQKDLQAYYTGLVGRNITKRQIPENKIVPTQALIKKTETNAHDVATYRGTISMLDYMAQRPITLNCVIHVKNCQEREHTAILFEISPQPFTHPIWKEFNQLLDDFKCSK